MEKSHKDSTDLSWLCQCLLQFTEAQKGNETKEISQERKKKIQLERMKENLQKKRKRKEMECAQENSAVLFPYFSPRPFKWTINLPSSLIFPLHLLPIFHNHLRHLSFWKKPRRWPPLRPSLNIQNIYNPRRYPLLHVHPHENPWRPRCV